jgi:hypothetical protein
MVVGFTTTCAIIAYQINLLQTLKDKNVQFIELLEMKKNN